MKKKKRKKTKLLLVDWVDSCGNPGWKASDELQADIVHCQTVGFFVRETKVAIVVALSRSKKTGYKPYGDLISIPKLAITRMRVLGEVKAAK
jgi:hypothetical protein